MDATPIGRAIGGHSPAWTTGTLEHIVLQRCSMHTQHRPTGSHDRALGMRGALLQIAERADAEAMRCSHVLAALDLARSRDCKDLARRASALATSILDWRHASTPQERRLADALEYQAIVQESSRLALDAAEREPAERAPAD